MKATRSDLDRNRSLSIEALRFTMMLCQQDFRDLTSLLRAIEIETEKPPFSDTLRVFAYCWQIVDTVDRARELSGTIAGLKHKAPEYQLFLRKTEGVEEFRNAYQHLATDIPRRPAQSQPSMGSFGWVTAKDPLTSISLWLGGGSPDSQAYGLVFGIVEGKFVKDFLLSAGNRDLRIDELVRAVDAFAHHFERWLTAENILGDRDIGTSRMRFQIKDERGESA